MGHGNERIRCTAASQGGRAGIVRRNEASGELVGRLVEDGEPQHGVGEEAFRVGSNTGAPLFGVVDLAAN